MSDAEWRMDSRAAAPACTYVTLADAQRYLGPDAKLESYPGEPSSRCEYRRPGTAPEAGGRTATQPTLAVEVNRREQQRPPSAWRKVKGAREVRVPIAGVDDGSTAIRLGFGPGNVGGRLLVWNQPFLIQVEVRGKPHDLDIARHVAGHVARQLP